MKKIITYLVVVTTVLTCFDSLAVIQWKNYAKMHIDRNGNVGNVELVRQIDQFIDQQSLDLCKCLTNIDSIYWGKDILVPITYDGLCENGTLTVTRDRILLDDAKVIGNRAQSASQGASLLKTVTGIVVDASDNEPVIGAQICVKGSKNVTATDFDGKFSICVTDGTILTVSCLGLKPQEVVADSRQPMTVVLETDENAPVTELISCPQPISVIPMDSLDYVLPESEFLIAQKYNKDLQGEFYQLKQTDIGRAKWLLNREITRRAYQPGTGPMPLENYAKQYFGVKCNGHRLIYINLLAKANLEDHNFIDKKLIIVFDGGDKFGRALIDLDTEGIVYILINGPKNVVKN